MRKISLQQCDIYSAILIIDGEKYYINNYKYSEIRAYLNGLDFYDCQDHFVKKSDYVNNGFLQTAFTDIAQSLIATTTVDNSGESTTDVAGTYPKADGTDDSISESYRKDYTCSETTEKIFLLSIKEISSYGFKSDLTEGDVGRARFPTDYAKANYVRCSYSEPYRAHYWLRSPAYDSSSRAAYIRPDGCFVNDYINIVDSNIGVVPALCLDLQ